MSLTKIKISPSIIASDLSSIGYKIKDYDPELIDLLHIDVMDGHFVPNLTIGPGYIKSLKGNTLIPLDVHLMIEKPENSIEAYMELNPWCITIHHESTLFPVRLLNMISKKGIKAGLSINPSTPVEAIFDILEYTDLVLIMSVDPGFYGQKFMKTALKKIEKLKSYISEESLKDISIQVDGGINLENINTVVKAGAEIIVTGSAAFKGKSINENVKELKERALSGS